MRYLAVVLLLALMPSLARSEALDAGDVPTTELFIIPVREGAFSTPNGQVFEVDGGVYLDNTASFTVARELASLRAENTSLKTTPVLASAPSTPVGVLIALTVGLVCGAGGATYLLLRK